jgi:hypothetical protein
MSFLSRLFGAKAPVKPRIVAHVAHGGAIRVFEAPTSDGWQHDEVARSGDGFSTRVVKYVLDAQPAPLALLAKVYTIDADRPPPDDPRGTDWRAAFAALFSAIERVDDVDADQLTMKSSIPAVQATIDGTSADNGRPLRIRERRSVVGREQFIVTAMGPYEVFEDHAAEIESWFTSVAFVPTGE